MTSHAVTCNKFHIHRLSWDNLLGTVVHFPNLQALDLSYYNKEQPRYETLCRILDLCPNLVVLNIVAASWKARRYLSAITSKQRMLQVLILTPSDCNRATKLPNNFISSCLGSAPQLQSIIGISVGYDVCACELHGLKYLSSDSYLVTKKFPCQTPDQHEWLRVKKSSDDWYEAFGIKFFHTQSHSKTRS